MQSNLINEDISNPLILKDKVVIMEDSVSTKDAIIAILRNQLKWDVILCENQEEAVKIARQKHAGFFILDNWVGDNKEEGLDALERIKNIDKTIFVAILTSHSSKRESAKKLGSNLFIEKNNLKLNILEIVDAMLRYRQKIVTNLSNEINKQLENNEKLIKETNKKIKYIEQLESLYKGENYDPSFSDSPEYMQAKNRETYENCKSDTEWLEEHQGKYAAFVDGDFDFACEDRDKFFDRLINFTKYKEKQIFFVKVEKEERIIDEPTSLRFELT